MLEAIGIAFVVLIWAVSSLIKGFKWLLRQTNPPLPPQAPPPSSPVPPQAPFQAQPQFQAPSQFQTPSQLQPPPRTPPGQPVRERPRQPQAGGPAVPAETNRQDFLRQERELFAAEPAGLGAALVSPAPVPPAAPPLTLFGGTDDLVRAIILGEVLSPPLSRRKSSQ